MIQNLYWDRHAKIKEQIAQVHALIETTANAFKNGPKADTSAGAFYDVFQSESKELIKLCCQAYGIGLRVFLEAVELDLNVVLGDMANLPQQKEGQSILGLIPDIAAYYSQYTTKLALLIESVRLTSIQITIDQGIRDEIVNFADAFDIENGMIADTINDMIRAGSAEVKTDNRPPFLFTFVTIAGSNRKVPGDQKALCRHQGLCGRPEHVRLPPVAPIFLIGLVRIG